MEKKTFMAICHKCDHGFLFCGSPLEITCPKCGARGKRSLEDPYAAKTAELEKVLEMPFDKPEG